MIVGWPWLCASCLVLYWKTLPGLHVHVRVCVCMHVCVRVRESVLWLYCEACAKVDHEHSTQERVSCGKLFPREAIPASGAEIAEGPRRREL